MTTSLTPARRGQLNQRSLRLAYATAGDNLAEGARDRIARAHERLDVVEGHPATTLIDAAEGADLLVVGSHGRGAFTSLLLGSVSLHCVAHAPCPVVVARPAGPS